MRLQRHRLESRRCCAACAWLSPTGWLSPNRYSSLAYTSLPAAAIFEIGMRSSLLSARAADFARRAAMFVMRAVGEQAEQLGIGRQHERRPLGHQVVRGVHRAHELIKGRT